MSRPEVSIVIPTLDRLDLLKQAVGTIMRQPQPFSAEVLVVDAGTDGSGEWAQAEGCRVITRPGATFAQGVNAGAAEARGDMLILMNNDVIPDDGCLGTLWRACQATREHVFVGARLRYPNGLIQHAGIGFDVSGNPYPLWQLAPHEHPAVVDRSYPPAVSFALVGLSAYVCGGLPPPNETGGLDESYRNAYEDIDLCLRARETGWQIVYEPAATAIHLEGQSPGRHDHDAESWAVFKARWVDTGRLWRVLGCYPFSVKQAGAA